MEAKSKIKKDDWGKVEKGGERSGEIGMIKSRMKRWKEEWKDRNDKEVEKDMDRRKETRCEIFL